MHLSRHGYLSLFIALALGRAADASDRQIIRPVFENRVFIEGGGIDRLVTDAIQGQPGMNPAALGVHGKFNNNPARTLKPKDDPGDPDIEDGLTLVEYSVGQPVATFTPSPSFAPTVVAQVRAALYPPPGADRASVENSTAAFRYLSLLYSVDPGQTDVTNHFQQISSWYGPVEDALIDEQIDILREALVLAPLDAPLRNLLLDAHTDRAIARVQFIKSDLEALGRKRLGLEITSPFIIDEEIELLESITGKLRGVLDDYENLLSTRTEGVEPSDFDPTATPGTPFGYYIFQKQQPSRNQTPSRYFAKQGGPAEPVPAYEEGSGNVIPRPADEVLANGYKDLATLLTVMADYLSYSADLNRLRGLRQLPASGTTPSDLEIARSQIATLLESFPTDRDLLREMFAGQEFRPGDTSGVFGAFTAIDTSFGELTNTQSFLNGTANLLGLDPDFLILFSDNAVTYDRPGGTVSSSDSFGQIITRLRGPNRPLTVALEKLADAEADYTTFNESVDRVTEELRQQNIAFASRFREITGYEPDEEPGWDGFNPKPAVGSELEVARQDLQLLRQRQTLTRGLLAQFDLSESQAKSTLAKAEALDDVVTAAELTYVNTAKPLFNTLALNNGLAAAGQAVADAALTGLSLDPANAIFSGGGTALAITAVGATNAAGQGYAAGQAVSLERQIDAAAKAYETELQRADNALTVSQAQDTLQDLLRERFGARIEDAQVASSIAQTIAREKALMLELKRIEGILATNTEAVRSTYYANPIHFIRSQNAILDAAAAFEEAQRWMFYAQRALEHKWTQKFAIGSGGRNYDGGSIFKMRNAEELDDLLTAFLAYDANREAGDIRSSEITSVISFKNHILTPNPARLNLTPALRADPGVRVDFETGETVSQLDLFRSKLRSFTDQDGSIVIPFNTALLQDIESLFIGPEYSSTGNINSQGQWRDKIHYVKVNIIADDGPVGDVGGLQPARVAGAISYGGLTMFRTRVVPRPGLLDRLTLPTNADPFRDRPGEFVVRPFRHYSSENLDNVFNAANSLLAPGTFAYTGRTARASSSDPSQEDVIGGSTFRFNDFNELSVAATRWTLRILANQPNQTVDVNRIRDIELIIRHQASSRVLPAN